MKYCFLISFLLLFSYAHAEEQNRNISLSKISSVELFDSSKIKLEGISSIWTKEYSNFIELPGPEISKNLRLKDIEEIELINGEIIRSEERRVGKECRL